MARVVINIGHHIDICTSDIGLCAQIIDIVLRSKFTVSMFWAYRPISLLHISFLVLVLNEARYRCSVLNWISLSGSSMFQEKGAAWEATIACGPLRGNRVLYPVLAPRDGRQPYFWGFAAQLKAVKQVGGSLKLESTLGSIISIIRRV